MRDRLLADSKNEIKLIEGSGGAFEVTRDGDVIFSKKSLNRFPNDDEIDAF